ncbi:DUF6429 family protein [Roseobacter sp. MED193]|uniref:DUF6429 family protein n=1 Tax=Roseobacter sp. MED193 TaxID=314262 RepID=UPI0034A0C527
MDWAVTDRLCSKGLFENSSGRAKSLVLKDEGFTKAKAAFWCLRHSREFLRGHDPMLLV